MALDAAILRLRERLLRLDATLGVLKARLADGCPDEAHYLYGRMTDAVPEAEGWVRRAKRIVRTADAGHGHAAVRLAVTKLDHAFRKLRQVLTADLIGRTRIGDLADLGRRKKKLWAAWVSEVQPAVTDLRRATADTARGIADCWRELACQAPPGVVVNNTLHAK